MALSFLIFKQEWKSALQFNTNVFSNECFAAFIFRSPCYRFIASGSLLSQKDATDITVLRSQKLFLIYQIKYT
jgi:hypothetical protein